MNQWTNNERYDAIEAYLESDEARRYKEVFSGETFKEQDRELFLRDAERRRQFAGEEAGQWWESMIAMLKDSPNDQLALAEILAQNGLDVEDLYRCLPETFGPDALTLAVNQARNLEVGGLTPGITNTAAMTEDQILLRLEEVKDRLKFSEADDRTRRRWEEIERESRRMPANALRLAEELANRNVTLAEFFQAFDAAGTDNIQAILHYLDYSRLKRDGEQSGWWLKPAQGMTRSRGWSVEQIQGRLGQVKEKLNWEGTDDAVKIWWLSIEQENSERPSYVLRLAEEIAYRKATLNDFYRAVSLAGTINLQADLHYLDYLRLKEAISTFAYQTVLLDESGQTKEHRWLSARQFVEELSLGVLLEMVEVPGGNFLMGTADEDVEKVVEEYARYWDEEGAKTWVSRQRPAHKVIVSPFFIGKYSVTQEQWRVVANWPKVEIELNPDPSNFKGSKLPVEQVSWEDAKEFCARLTRQTGREYRLPSEAEWEYACRAGTASPFAFGETITPEIVNYDGNRPYAKAKKGVYRQATIPVGSLGVANTYGLYDIHGNVWEWCEDTWHKDYEGAPTDGSAWLSGEGSSRVLRGGSWDNNGNYCRSAVRGYDAPVTRSRNYGFRVVVGARAP